MPTQSSENGALTLRRMNEYLRWINISEYVGHATVFIRMLAIACWLVVGLGLRYDSLFSWSVVNVWLFSVSARSPLHLTTFKAMVIVWRLRGDIIRTVLCRQSATSSADTVNENSSYSLVGSLVCLFVFLGCIHLYTVSVVIELYPGVSAKRVGFRNWCGWVRHLAPAAAAAAVARCESVGCVGRVIATCLAHLFKCCHITEYGDICAAALVDRGIWANASPY